jgi:hypothetical protein
MGSAGAAGALSEHYHEHKYLITGGAGFIGSHLADELLTHGYHVRVLDTLSPQVHGTGGGRPAYLHPDVELIWGDIRDASTMRRALEEVEAVFHFAAAVGVGQSMDELEKYTGTNTLGTAVLLEAPMERPGLTRGTGTPILGVHEWFRPGEYDHVEEVLADLRTLGVTDLRTGFSWADWCTEEGETWYGWLLPRLAREVNVLCCFTYTPPSLGIMPKTTAPPRNPKDYADFLDVVITRFGKYFEWVELWNEPNDLNDWDWRLDPSWQTFCEMVGGAAYWVQQRGKKTVLGGMCPTDPNWLDLICQRGVLQYIDAVSVHGFPGIWEFDWKSWSETIAKVQRVLTRHRIPADIWITEAGYSTWRHDEHRQLCEFVNLAEAPVPRVYWYSAYDLHPDLPHQDGFREDERHYHFGLKRANGKPKLLFLVWANEGLEGVKAFARLGSTASIQRAAPLTVNGKAIRGLYLTHGWAKHAWTWHEAANTRVFFLMAQVEKQGDLVWIGNWGDEERTAELQEFLLAPVADLGLRARVHGVRYAKEACEALAAAGIEYAGWLPNYKVPQVFAQFRVALHIPRRPYVKVLPGIPTIRPFEALACGIPLVCSPWLDVEGLFTPGKDFLMARHGQEMRRHLQMLLHDYNRAQEMAAHGRQTILQRHTCAHRVDELLQIYEELRRTPTVTAASAVSPRRHTRQKTRRTP